MNNFEFIVEENGVRVDAFVSKNMQDTSRTMAAQLAADGRVLCNGKPVQKSHKLKGGDTLIISVPPPKLLDAIPQDIPIDIVYEDDCLIVINKKKGMVVHPSMGNDDGTLVNALLHHCKGGLSAINGTMRPGIVHRIDKNTSGLLVCAKTNEAHACLAQQFAEHTITRQYHAVVHGAMKCDGGFVEAPIGRHAVHRKRMAVREQNGKYAYTSYDVIADYRGFSHVALRLKTGRTHQIRVHMAHIMHPVVGDDVYGPKNYVKQTMGQCLHAKTLGFIHPTTGEYIEFTSELPDYFIKFLKTLKQ